MIRYLENNTHVFNPETVQILSCALDDAWQQVQADEMAYKIDGNAAGARDALAKYIVDMAKQGERDHQLLVQGAMTRLKL